MLWLCKRGILSIQQKPCFNLYYIFLQLWAGPPDSEWVWRPMREREISLFKPKSCLYRRWLLHRCAIDKATLTIWGALKMKNFHLCGAMMHMIHLVVGCGTVSRHSSFKILHRNFQHYGGNKSSTIQTYIIPLVFTGLGIPSAFSFLSQAVILYVSCGLCHRHVMLVACIVSLMVSGQEYFTLPTNFTCK